MRSLFLATIALVFAIQLCSTNSARANVYTVTNSQSSGPGSLADTILLANLKAGADTIQFAIPSLLQKPVRIDAAGMQITEQLLIDGYSQPGAVQNTASADEPFNGVLKLEISGSFLSGLGPILQLDGADSIIRGLAFIEAGSFAISLEGSGGHRVEGCFIGIKALGSYDPALRNQNFGVYVSSAYNFVGGTTPAARNVLAGNKSAQVYVRGGHCKIRGNIMGLLPDGITPIPEAAPGDGVVVFGDNNQIGGLPVGSRNVISGLRTGIYLLWTAENNVIRQNRIGTDITGTLAVGNSQFGINVADDSPGTRIGGGQPTAPNTIAANWMGIRVAGTDTIVRQNDIGIGVGDEELGNTEWGIQWWVGNSGGAIGGASPTQGNRIAHNGAGGIMIANSPSRVAVRNNSIFSNTNASGMGMGLGIDVRGASGVTGNDFPDLDGTQNFPVLTKITLGANNDYTISGTLESMPDPGDYTIEIFASPDCDPSGYGEGEIVLGSGIISSSPFVITVPAAAPVGYYITAMATSNGSGASEFSACLQIPDPFLVTTVNDSGVGSLRTAIANANASASVDTIRFAIPGSGPHTILVSAALPPLTETVRIDGSSQSGWSPNTVWSAPGFNADLPIVIAALPTPSATGIEVAAAGCSLVGLHITGFVTGVDLTGIAVSSEVQGCRLEGNNDGIFVNTSGSLIGGTSATLRNHILSNTSSGINLVTSAVSILGNSIGANDSGTAPAGNPIGVRIIGLIPMAFDSSPATNYIVGNALGIGVHPLSVGCRIASQVVGWPGIGNTDAGIDLSGADHQVGGIPGNNDGNLIQWNDGPGIRINNGTGHSIQDNSIANNGAEGIAVVDGEVLISENIFDANGGLAIDLGIDGVTPNQLDAITDYPVITGVFAHGDSTTITGSMSGTIGDAVLIHFYTSDRCDPSGHGEGLVFLGSAELLIGPSPKNFYFDIPQSTSRPIVTATATINGATSEFSLCKTRTATATLPVASTPGRLRLHHNFPNPFNPRTTISFELPEDGIALLQVYDLRGHLLRTLVDGRYPAGSHETQWNGRDKNDHELGSGVYFYRLRAAGRELSRRMTLLK